MIDVAGNSCVVIGAGGHARVLLDILLSSEPPVSCVLLDSDPSRWGTAMMTVPIVGDDSLLPELARKGARFFSIGAGSAGRTALRSSLYESALRHGLQPLTVVHRSACRSRWSEAGLGLQQFAGSVVNSGAVLGANVVINTGAIVEHDCRVEDHGNIATGARLCGGVHVGRGAFIGAGAVVRQGIAIGENACVGAGAVVIRDVAPGITVVGSPAAPLNNNALFESR